MPRVVHFEIHADDPQRAIDFYSALFGWKFQHWDGPMDYWMIETGPEGTTGINGGLIKRMGEQSGNAVIAYVCTIDVSSVDEYYDKILARGGISAVPKMAIPGVGWLAYCKDPEGNIFGIMQGDPNAA